MSLRVGRIACLGAFEVCRCYGPAAFSVSKRSGLSLSMSAMRCGRYKYHNSNEPLPCRPRFSFPFSRQFVTSRFSRAFAVSGDPNAGGMIRRRYARGSLGWIITPRGEGASQRIRQSPSGKHVSDGNAVLGGPEAQRRGVPSVSRYP